jgi:hypothetical protein
MSVATTGDCTSAATIVVCVTATPSVPGGSICRGRGRAKRLNKFSFGSDMLLRLDSLLKTVSRASTSYGGR